MSGVRLRHPRSGPPIGFFSAYQCLLSRQWEGRVVQSAQKLKPAGKESLRNVCGMGQDGWQPWPVFWVRHHNARLVGDSLVHLDEKKNACVEAVYGDYVGRDDPSMRYLWLPSPVFLEGNWTSVIARWADGFYHWFLDALPRLALLPEFPQDTRILVPGPLRPYQCQTLQWLGLENRIRSTVEKHLIIEDYFFSSPTALTGCDNPYAIHFLRETFLKFADVSSQPPLRFYVTRLNKSRAAVNESAVIDLFLQSGWAVIDPEELSLPQQIQLFANAEAVCGIHGGGLTHLLWCRPGCKVLELCARNYLNGCYEGLASYLSLDYHYMICEADEGFGSRVDLDAVARWLLISSTITRQSG